MSKIKRSTWEFLFVIALFVACVAIRFILANWHTIKIETLGDELLYYRIAASIHNGTGIAVYNIPQNFYKVLYSLVIQPAFLFDSVRTRISAIMFINSVLLNSGVFPVYYLSKKLIKSGVYRIGVCMAYLLHSNMTFVMTFMSENLFIPLGLLLLCIFYKIFADSDTMTDKQKIIINMIAGIVSYLFYMTKEVALVIPLSYAAYLISLYIYRKIRKTGLPFWWSMVKQGISYAAGFFVPYYLVNTLVFLSEASNYGSVTPVGMVSNMVNHGGSDRIQFLFIGFVFFVCTVVIGTLAAPVLFSGVYIDKMSSGAKKLYSFLIWALLATAVVVSYTITLSYDYESKTLSMHTRYISWIFIPFVIVFVHAIEQINKEKLKDSLNRLGYIILFSLLLIVFFRGGDVLSAVDATMRPIADMNGNEVLFMTIGLCAFCVILFLLLMGKKAFVVPLFLAAFFAQQANENIATAGTIWNVYYAYPEVVEKIEVLSDYIDEQKDSKFLFIDGFAHSIHKYFDTYVTQTNVYVSYLNGVKKGKETVLVPSDTEFPAYFYGGGILYGKYYEKMDIGYIITPGGIDISGDGCSLIDEVSNSMFKVYKLEDSGQPITIKTGCLRDGEKIGFTSDTENSNSFIRSGIWDTERYFTWTSSKSVVFERLSIDEGEKNASYNMNISWERVFNAPQTVEVICNGDSVYKNVIDDPGAQTISVPVTTDENGELQITINLPDCISPLETEESSDYRKLALALTEITFTKAG